MDPYEELLAKRAQLDAELTVLRTAKRPEVIEQIGRLMREYEISLEELEDWQARQGGDRRRRRVPPRYLDPQTGATWSGRGKQPRWMAGRDPEEFRIRSAEVMPPSGVSPHDELARALFPGTGLQGTQPANTRRSKS